MLHELVITHHIFYICYFGFAGVMPSYGHEHFCTVRPEYSQMLNIVGNIDAVITMVLPFLTIFILNSLILYTVFRYHSSRNSMVIKHKDSDQEVFTDCGARKGFESPGLSKNQSSLAKSSSYIPQQRMLQHGDRQSQSKTSTESHDRKQFTRSNSSRSVLRMTKMLVIVSTSFLLLNLPSHSIRVYYFFVSWMNKYHLMTHRLQSCLKLFRSVLSMFKTYFFLTTICFNTHRAFEPKILYA